MKIKVSIVTRIALLLVAALIIATAITVTISYHSMLKDAEEQSVNKSTTAATAAMVAIGSEEGFYALYKDEALRKNVHKTFRFICKRTGLRYVKEKNEDFSTIKICQLRKPIFQECTFGV